MNDEKNKRVDLGMFNRPGSGQITPVDIAAAGLSVVWVLIAVVFLIVARDAGGTLAVKTVNALVTALVVIVPLALIWVAALAVRSIHMVREESLRLRTAMDVLRQNYLDLQQTRRMQITPADPKGLPAPGLQPAQFSTRRDQPAKKKPGVQGDLALGLNPAASAPQLTPEDFIMALNFPKTAEDKEGFRALRRALHDPYVGRLVQASQDVLTLLSQDGIYMDDLTPDRARPEVWRRFAQGERGRPVAMLGGVRDRSSLALSAQRMRRDHIFRDATHHFLRQFDHTLAAFEPDASDAEISALSETRTARAFMLMGRVAGTFN
jgi:hypothetical protein